MEASLIEFFEAAWPNIDPAPFVPGWHLEAIAEHLQAVAEGQIRRLLINVPPRHTKTLLTSVAFPAWVWAQKPDPDIPLIGPQVKFMCLSYGDGLAMDNATLARRLISSEWYQERWGHRVKITGDQDAKNKFDTTAGGTRISSSFGAGVLGRGADIKIIDDPHKVDEAESEIARERVIRTYDGTLKSRVTDPKISAEVTIMQRLHEDDLAGHLLEQGDDIVLLRLPAEYESKYHCRTVLGWEDPRTEEGDLLWPERFGLEELAPFKRNPYEWSGQWQQAPVPRGGAIFRREWWQLWESVDGKFPELDYVVASLDGAFTEKEENDPSGFTVWGVWSDNGVRKLILIDAWRKHLQLHGPRINQVACETKKQYEFRTKPQWGLVEWVAYSCRRFKVDRLLIEGKANGIDVANEMQRLYGDEQWSVQLEPVKGDKVARALAVVPAFTQELVYAPDRDWAEMVIAEMEVFPKGRHDDCTDSATQALKHLRMVGLIQHPDERVAEEDRRTAYRPKAGALYPV